MGSCDVTFYNRMEVNDLLSTEIAAALPAGHVVGKHLIFYCNTHLLHVKHITSKCYKTNNIDFL